MTTRPPKKLLSILATVLWLSGFACPFVFPKGSPWLWLGDALLLLGFWPLLWMLSAWWAWLGFGLLNFGSGCVLMLVRYLKDSDFGDRPDIIKVKHHLADYHYEYVWMLIGLVSICIGLVSLVNAIINWQRKRSAPP